MVKDYLLKLLHHATNGYSVASLAMGFFAALLSKYIDSHVVAIIATIFAFLSVPIAGYYVWKDEFESKVLDANLSIIYKSVNFGSNSSRGGIPLSPVTFRISLDAINYGEQTAILQNIEITNFNMNNELLGEEPKPIKLLLPNSPHGRNPISFPFPIEGKQRFPNLEIQISTVLKIQDPKDFARRLKEFTNYEIKIAYSYEDMSRTKHTDSLSITGTFDDFKNDRLRDWRSTPNNHELALIAIENMGLIP